MLLVAELTALPVIRQKVEGKSKTVAMKKWIIASMVWLLAGCHEQREEPPVNVSTVDSNTITPPDPNLPGLYLDSHQVDTSFVIAMDSVVPDILPKDTNYRRH